MYLALIRLLYSGMNASLHPGHVVLLVVDRLRTRETGILSKMPFHLALLIETVISADGAELYSHMEEN